MNTPIRRRDLCAGILLSSITGKLSAQKSAKPAPAGFRSLFDGVSLHGWTRKPRELARPSLGRWEVRDGIIIGGQDPPGSGLGSYLVSDEKFGDFELMIDARPDWRADTGVYVRTNDQGNIGFQVLLDHRPHGGIGGYYGNQLGSFHAWSYMFDGETDKNGRLVRLIPEPAREPNAHNHTVPLDFVAPAEVFLKIWKVDGWNTFHIRSVGAIPHLTTWINGEKISELDTAKMKSPGWDPQDALAKVGRTGHIALEVHSNGPNDVMGKNRWYPGNVCRWRNIYVKEL